MHTKTKGSIAELAVASRLLRDGWHVLIPVGENTRYDLVVEKEGRFVRVQVKYATPKNGALPVNCCSSNNWSVLQYTADEIDVIAAYDSVSKEIYFIPVEQIRKGHMKLRIEPPRNNQRLKVRFASDFSVLHEGAGEYDPALSDCNLSTV